MSRAEMKIKSIETAPSHVEIKFLSKLIPIIDVLAKQAAFENKQANDNEPSEA